MISFFTVKRSYYKLARIFHPDRAAHNEITDANEKFSIIHQAYTILCDATKKQQYDDGNWNVLFAKKTMSKEWMSFVRPINQSDMSIAQENYQNSDEERNDIKRAYIDGNGSLTYILNNVPFMRVEDEQRVLEIIKILVANEDVPKFKIKKIAK